MEQRIWLRQKWTRQFAMVDASGMLIISSPSRYDRQKYFLSGARAFFIDKGAIEIDDAAPLICIVLSPSLQLDGATRVAFRLTSAADAAPWMAALSRSIKPDDALLLLLLRASAFGWGGRAHRAA